MKKIYSIVAVITILSFVLVSCRASGENNLGDTLSGALENIQVGEEQNGESDNPENIGEQNNYGYENPKNIDYSAYNALVRSYRKALSSSYGELTDDYMGYFYANLIDLNADDVYELVIARVHNSDADGNTDEMFNTTSEHFIGAEWQNIVHVYYLNESGAVSHAGEYPLSFYGEEGMQFNIEYTEVDGINYLAFGGDILDFGITSSDYVFAKSFMKFNGKVFQMAEAFSIQYEYADGGYEPTEYRQNMNIVSEGDFEAQFFDNWNKNLIQHTFIAKGYETNADEITQNTIGFLSNFELKDTHGEAFTYSNGNFVIYERSYTNAEEVAFKYLADAIAYQDFASMQPYAENEDIIEYYSSAREDGQYYPGLIVEEMDRYYHDEYGWSDVQLVQAILEDENLSEMYAQNGLENTFVLKVDAKEIIDMEVVQYAGQFGLNVTQYYLFETDEEGNNHRLLAVFDDNYYQNYSNVYEVSYITDYEQIFNAYGYEYPVDIMNMYFTSEETDNMSHYITDDAKEVYFIRNLWGGTMKVYVNYIDENMEYARGALLHETSADVLYLGCSSDNVEDYIMYTDVQIVTEPFPGYEVVYYPGIAHPDTRLYIGGYAQEMQRLN